MKNVKVVYFVKNEAQRLKKITRTTTKILTTIIFLNNKSSDDNFQNFKINNNENFKTFKYKNKTKKQLNIINFN